jgi:hypothetical protein
MSQETTKKFQVLGALNGTSVAVTSVEQSPEDGGENIVTFSDGNTLTVLNGTKGTRGLQGASLKITSVGIMEDGSASILNFSDGTELTVENGKDGVSATHSWNGTVLSITSASGTSSADLKGEKGDPYTLTDADKAEIVKETVETINAKDSVPTYWQNHLDEKIATVKALQNEGGKDCFSFVVMTDMHYPSNLGKNSPILAKEILDKCDIKFALCLGDTQTRGCYQTKELLLAENEAIEEMLSPIRDRLLQTEGNHDGSYGLFDKDGDGTISNKNSDGSFKEPAERETYVYNLTPEEQYNVCYRKVGLVGDCHFDESGTGYWIDDVSSKVRYIILHTQRNEYELQEDGTVKYPEMWLFRFTQPQFDLVEEALNSVPSNAWSVVVAGHCPLFQEIGDREIMQGVLNAYKNKTTYTGKYAGTAEGGVSYKNLAEPLPDNTTDITKWVNGYRYSSSGGASAQSGTTLSNPVICTGGDVIRIKGVTLRENTDRICLYTDDEHFTTTDGVRGYFNAGITFGVQAPMIYNGLENGVYTFTLSNWDDYEIKAFRFAMPTPTDASQVIITVNEEIVEGAVTGYDAVSVDCDFSNAKGELIGYFAGHNHIDSNTITNGVSVITTRCDGNEENDETLKAERVAGTTTEQSFDVFTVNKKTGTIHATKIGAGSDREISY